MTTNRSLSTVRAVLLDMDGVLFVGETPLPGVQEFLDYLDATGRGWLCITNNASRTAASFSDKLAQMGIRVPPAHVLSSAEAAALWLAEEVESGRRPAGPVYAMGMEGLRSALAEQGFPLTSDPFAAAYLVAGANFNLTYNDLADSALAIRNGAFYIGTNPDTSYPTERGHVPGTGSILALLTAATGVEPIVIGKPNAAMFEIAMHRLHAEPARTLMVGDRYETDIAGAARLGLHTAAMLTGISTRQEFESADPRPDVIAAGLPDLLRLLQAADGV